MSYISYHPKKSVVELEYAVGMKTHDRTFLTLRANQAKTKRPGLYKIRRS